MTKSGGVREKKFQMKRSGIERRRGAVVREESEKERVYDLEERTARFGEQVIDFARIGFGKTPSQIESSTNSWERELVSAQIMSKPMTQFQRKKFLKNIGTCKKEVREVKHFLRMAVRAVPELKPKAGQPLAGGARTTSDLLEDLEERKK